MTVSDTRQMDNDRSGDTLVGRIEAAGHRVADRKILTDDREDIAAQLRIWCAAPDIDAILTTGGTGLTGRDVTDLSRRIATSTKKRSRLSRLFSPWFR